jgi:hypothetical protein
MSYNYEEELNVSTHHTKKAPDNVIRLIQCYLNGSSASPIAGNILRTLMNGKGSFEWYDIFLLDEDNRRAAIELIEVMGMGYYNKLPISENHAKLLK